MKIYAIIGTSTEVIDCSSNPKCPENYIEMSVTRPTPEHVAQEDGTWAMPAPTVGQQIAEIKARLDAIDAKSIRPLRSIANGYVTDDDWDMLSKLDQEAFDLREQLASLQEEKPDPESEVEIPNDVEAVEPEPDDEAKDAFSESDFEEKEEKS